MFCLRRRVQIGSGVHPASYRTDHSPPSIAEVRDARPHTSSWWAASLWLYHYFAEPQSESAESSRHLQAVILFVVTRWPGITGDSFFESVSRVFFELQISTPVSRFQLRWFLVEQKAVAFTLTCAFQNIIVVTES